MTDPVTKPAADTSVMEAARKYLMSFDDGHGGDTDAAKFARALIRMQESQAKWTADAQALFDQYNTDQIEAHEFGNRMFDLMCNAKDGEEGGAAFSDESVGKS